MCSHVALVVVLISVAVALIYRDVVLCPVAYHPVNLQGKIAIVTGGSSGIGYETAKKFKEWNATVILPVRNMAKGNAVRQAILSSLGDGVVGDMVVMELDLASFSSVRMFAKNVKDRYHHIDIVVLNAGMQNGDDLIVTEDGIELVYQVNYLSHFLLTRLLLPLMASSHSNAPSRIVHVSSSMHYGGVLDMSAYSSTAKNTLAGSRRLGMASYCDTKLMNVVFSNALETRLRQGGEEYDGVTSVSVHPGFVVSELDRGLSPVLQGLLKVIRRLVARPTVDGAVTQVTAATRPSLLRFGGGLYFEDHCVETACTKCLGFWKVHAPVGAGLVPHFSALDTSSQDWLWETSSDIVGVPSIGIS